METRLAIKNRDVTPLEQEVAKIIHEFGNQEGLKEKLRNLRIAGAKEMTLKDANGRELQKTVLITVPYPSLVDTQKNLMKLIFEIEKKKKLVTFIIAKRTIISKRVKLHASQMRPRNRTLTAVHDAILEDLIFPGHITGRRVRYTGTRCPTYKVTVNEEARKFTEPRLSLIVALYQKLTNRNLEITFKSAINFVPQLQIKKKEATN